LPQLAIFGLEIDNDLMVSSQQLRPLPYFANYNREYCILGHANVYPMPALLNHTGLQSSECSQLSPSVSFPGVHPWHFGELGQFRNGEWKYPISRNLK